VKLSEIPPGRRVGDDDEDDDDDDDDDENDYGGETIVASPRKRRGESIRLGVADIEAAAPSRAAFAAASSFGFMLRAARVACARSSPASCGVRPLDSRRRIVQIRAARAGRWSRARRRERVMPRRFAHRREIGVDVDRRDPRGAPTRAARRRAGIPRTRAFE